MYLTTAFLALLTTALVSMSMACADGVENVTIDVASITLDKQAMTLEPGDSSLLRAEVLPVNATNKNVKFEFSNPSIAMVLSSDAGSCVIIALNSGQTDVIATTEDGGRMAFCRLTVVISVTGVELNRPTLSLGVGGIETLVAKVTPPDATNQRVRWFASPAPPASVAIVDNDGIVTAVSPGIAYVSVVTEDGAYSDGCWVTVTPATHVPVTGVTLNKTNLAITVDTSETLMAGILPSDATNKNVSWKSNDDTIAAVSADGTVTGMSVGAAMITVTTQDGGFMATCAVTVAPSIIDVTGVTLEPSSLSLTVGDDAVVTAIVQPLNATNKMVLWESSDESVAAVTTVITGGLVTGVVTGVSAGTAIITATTDDGDFRAECEVNVANVYVAGYEEDERGTPVARLWIRVWANNDWQWLPRELIVGDNSTTYANSVFVSDGNVYVAGHEIIAGTRIAKLWINGAAMNLTTGSNNAQAHSVFVSGGKIYVAGYEEELGIPAARLWVNGVAAEYPLSGKGNEARAASVYVLEDNVYVAGDEVIDGISFARLWINNTAQNLSTGSGNAGASSVFVSDGRMCVAGYESTPQNPRQREARLWINGVPQRLSNVNAYARAASVCALGSNVYAVGYEMNAQERTVAMLWESNAGGSTLSNGSYDAAAASVFAHGNKVYAAGYENNAQGRSSAMLWINGFARPLTGGKTNAMANAVFVR
jgi:uncharacterized protein YjdB